HALGEPPVERVGSRRFAPGAGRFRSLRSWITGRSRRRAERVPRTHGREADGDEDNENAEGPRHRTPAARPRKWFRPHAASLSRRGSGVTLLPPEPAAGASRGEWIKFVGRSANSDSARDTGCTDNPVQALARGTG